MSEYIHKSHNVSVSLYHLVCPAKYRRVVISEEVDQTLKEVCEDIELPNNFSSRNGTVAQ
jgi:REP element-mobilizing transposase RayT